MAGQRSPLDHAAAEAVIKAVPAAMNLIRTEMQGMRLPALTLRQFQVLSTVAFAPRTNGDLAELLGVSRSAMSRMVATLVGKGLLASAASAADSRSVSIRITDDGRKLCGQVRVRAESGLALLLTAVPEATKVALIEGMRVLGEFVQACEREP